MILNAHPVWRPTPLVFLGCPKPCKLEAPPLHASSLYVHLCFVHLTLGHPIELLKNKRQNLLYIYLGTLGMIKSLASEVGIHVITCEENHERLEYVQFKK